MAAIQVPPDSTGKRVDTVTLTDALVEVHRQKMVVTGGSGTAEVVAVTNAEPAAGDMGLVVRHAGTATIAGNINISATATVRGTVSLGPGNSTIGDINRISAGVVLTSGASNIGHINHISATVTVAGNVNISTMPAVVLAAGAANIGLINNISATVAVTGTVVLAAGAANIGILDSISATVGVKGQVSLGPGNSTIGDINAISRSVKCAVMSMYTNAEVPSASRGPKLTVVSVSANTTLVAAPGAGMAVFVTQVAVSNAGAVGTIARVGCSASASTVSPVQMFLTSAGGGFVMNFTPPWQLSANEALLGSVKPQATDALFNVHFFVASADAA